MPQARSNIPTIAERLDKPQQLDSTVRSYSYSEYVEKRPDYVGFDKYGAGAGWGNLARALDKFYGEFRHQSNDVFLPQWKERGIAEGQEKFNAHSEGEGYTKNRLAFKEFVEAHPEMASNNPWVKVGYEQARLNTLSMEMENGLLQAMEDNGVMNEEDPAKAQQFAQNYIKFFKDNAGLTGYEDSVLLAKNFGSKEGQIFDNAMDRYETVRKQLRQDRMIDATIKEGVAVITNMLQGKSSQGLDPDLPENINSKNIIEVLKGIAERQAENGLLDSKGKDIVWGMIRSAYAQTNNRNVLKLCESAMFKDMKIIDDPQIAEWYNRTWEHLRNEDARKAREAQMDHDRKMVYQLDNIELKIANEFREKGTVWSEEAVTEELKKYGISPDSKYHARLVKGVARDMDFLDRRDAVPDILKINISDNLRDEFTGNKDGYVAEMKRMGDAYNDPWFYKEAARVEAQETQKYEAERRQMSSALDSVDNLAKSKIDEIMKTDKSKDEDMTTNGRGTEFVVNTAAHDAFVLDMKKRYRSMFQQAFRQTDRNLSFDERERLAKEKITPFMTSIVTDEYNRLKASEMLYVRPEINTITGADYSANTKAGNVPLNSIEIAIFNQKYGTKISADTPCWEAVNFLEDRRGMPRQVAAQAFRMIQLEAYEQTKKINERNAAQEKIKAQGKLNEQRLNEATKAVEGIPTL